MTAHIPILRMASEDEEETPIIVSALDIQNRSFTSLLTSGLARKHNDGGPSDPLRPKLVLVPVSEAKKQMMMFKDDEFWPTYDLGRLCLQRPDLAVPCLKWLYATGLWKPFHKGEYSTAMIDVLMANKGALDWFLAVPELVAFLGARLEAAWFLREVFRRGRRDTIERLLPYFGDGGRTTTTTTTVELLVEVLARNPDEDTLRWMVERCSHVQYTNISLLRYVQFPAVLGCVVRRVLGMGTVESDDAIAAAFLYFCGQFMVEQAADLLHTGRVPEGVMARAIRDAVVDARDFSFTPGGTHILSKQLANKHFLITRRVFNLLMIFPGARESLTLPLIAGAMDGIALLKDDAYAKRLYELAPGTPEEVASALLGPVLLSRCWSADPEYWVPRLITMLPSLAVASEETKSALFYAIHAMMKSPDPETFAPFLRAVDGLW